MKFSSAGLAAAALVIASSSASAQSNLTLSDATFDTLTADALAAHIKSDPELKLIVQQTSNDGTPVFVIEYEGLRSLVALKRSQNGAGIGLLQIGLYPDSVAARMSDQVVADLNAKSEFGWFSRNANGTVAFVNGDTLVGESARGVLFDFKLFTAIYAARGSESSTVAFEGGESSPRETIVDASHQPAQRIGLSQDTEALILAAGANLNAESVFGDAQRYGELRKILNDALGY
jgi:hypothetical protein